MRAQSSLEFMICAAAILTVLGILIQQVNVATEKIKTNEISGEDELQAKMLSLALNTNSIDAWLSAFEEIDSSLSRNCMLEGNGVRCGNQTSPTITRNNAQNGEGGRNELLGTIPI